MLLLWRQQAQQPTMRLVRGGMVEGHPYQIFQWLDDYELEDSRVLASCFIHSPLSG